MKIQRKLALGYTIIVALIGGIVYTYLHEWRQMNRLEREVKEIHRLRQNVHEAYVHMLDLTMFGETILEWEEADTALYRAKRMEVDSILCEFKNYYSGERIDSLRHLMAEKEIQLFNISQLFDRQMELGEELAERVPVIAYESTQEPSKKKGGFLGLFKKKEKTPSQSTTSTKLYTLNRDVIRKQSEQSRRLSETADSLAQRNLNINQRLKSLIAAMDERVTTDLQEREQQIIETRERTKVWLGGITAFIFLALLLSYIVIMRDYGRKERGRRKLEASNRKNAELLEMRNKIILTISHDIRGPLNNIIGYTELALDTREKKKRNLQLKKVLGRSKHILHLVNNLLDVYRLNQAKETMLPVPFRISDLLNRVVDGATQPINDKGLLFEHEFVGADAVVKGDVDRIEQIINNLIANAVKFTSAGHIGFNVTYMDGTFTMKVSDTGMGMTEDMMKRIYLPFERAANAENSDGYGLPIAHGIVTMLGGTINVESELNKGTTFTVTLPLPVTNEPIEEESVSFDASLHLPKNVIAIDDDMLQLELVKEMLERNGVSCTICSKVDKLTEALRKKNYDLLLSDIQMPNTDGFKLLELLRKSRIGNSKDIPIVAMTARSESEREALLEAGFDGCIFKPFSMNELLKVIASVVKGREPGSETDFSVMLANVSDKKKILRTMIETCEKDIVDLKIAMTAENRESMRSIAHRMFPMWEMVSMDEILLAYRNVLKDTDCDTQTVLNHTNHIITHIEHLIEDAGNEIERIVDEEKNIDSRG